ncbi:MAG: UbiX family flavin prenyltransferase [Planctomycetota bacterium]|nr:UbiX family flavin prenyltransferase [Planctomycetota bacterium]
MALPGSIAQDETPNSSKPARIFVGMTGASGHAYARALLIALAEAGFAVDLALSGAGAKVLLHEQGIACQEDGRIAPCDLEAWLGTSAAAAISVWGRDEIGAPPASGTALGAAVILCPCSMGTMARVAAGFSSNLVERAADVAIKERRRLIVVPREAPLSQLHLENMLRLSKLGATVLPACPGFYHQPKSIDDLVDHLVGKILDAAGIERASSVRWAGLAEEPPAEPGTSSPGVSS